MLYERLNRIDFLIDTKKYNEAQKIINECLADYPDTPELYGLIARMALTQSDHKKGLDAINTAIGLNPDIAEHYYLKAVLLTQKSEPKKAIVEIQRAIDIEPDVSAFYGQKAYILLRQNKKKEAIRWARHAKSINPNDSISTNVLSMALGTSGKIEEAHEVLGEMLADNPENDFTLSTAGYNYLRQGNIIKAKELFQSALMIDPTSVYAKSGMMEAIKGSNFFYRKIIQYQAWMERKSSKNQWVFIIGLLIVIRILPFLIPFYLIFVLWIWFAPPIANMVLYLDKHGRYLMDEELMHTTQVNLGLTSSSLISIAATPFLGSSLLGLAFALFVAIVPINGIHQRDRSRNKIVLGLFGVGFVLLGAIGVIIHFMGGDNSFVWVGLLLGIVAFTWLANLFAE